MERSQRNYRREEAPPLSPIAQICSHPKVGIIIQYAIGLKNPINIDVLKHEISNSIMIKLPRFSSLLVQDRNGRRQRWVPTKVDIDKHIIVVDDHRYHNGAGDKAPESKTKEEADEIINEYIAGFTVSSPLSFEKPLWEIHVLVEVRCLILRVHHAIGDGTSLMSMIWEMGRKDHHQQQQGGGGGGGSGSGSDDLGHGIRSSNVGRKGAGGSKLLSSYEKRKGCGFIDNLRCLWFGTVFGAQHMAKSTWLKDDKTVISGGAGVELRPRKLVTASFSLGDMKIIKTSVPNATINDVLLGVVWYGLSKYLQLQSPQVQKRLWITAFCMVNLRQQPGLQEISTLMKEKSKSRWGNKFSGFLVPVSIFYRDKGDGGSEDHPLDYLKRAKMTMDQKKQSKEAHLSYMVCRLLVSCLGHNVAAWFFNKLSCNTTLLISNIVGPPEEIILFDNPVTFIRVNGYAISQAITMHMVSYAGMANLQMLVARDIIPDPQLFAKCFEDAFTEMKASVISTASTK